MKAILLIAIALTLNAQDIYDYDSQYDYSYGTTGDSYYDTATTPDQEDYTIYYLDSFEAPDYRVEMLDYTIEAPSVD